MGSLVNLLAFLAFILVFSLDQAVGREQESTVAAQPHPECLLPDEKLLSYNARGS